MLFTLLLLLPLTLSFPLSPRNLPTPTTLPPLPYPASALEPHISTEIMTLHHTKHHQAYITNLNLALTALTEATAGNNLTGVISAQRAINFNGGGHINHSLFWENLAPVGTETKIWEQGALKKKVEEKWGSVEAFKEVFGAKLGGLQGSGWGWLVKDAQGGVEIVVNTVSDMIRWLRGELLT